MAGPITHCEPAGSPTLPILQPPAISFGSEIAATGTLKGILVFMFGLSEGNSSSFPPGLSDDGGAGVLPARPFTLCNTIAATGWHVICPVQPGYGFAGGAGGPTQAWYNDLSTDSGNGARLLATRLAWWDHLYRDIRLKIDPTVPICIVGFSGGGYDTLQIAAHRTSQIAGYCAMHPFTHLSQLNPAFSFPMDFGTLTTTAGDVTSTALNGVTSIPGMLSWGSVDGAIGPSPWTTDSNTPTLYSTALAAGAPVTPNCDGTGTTSAGGSWANNHVLTSSHDRADPNNDVFRVAAWFTANLPHN